jgi:hypothetical protein
LPISAPASDSNENYARKFNGLQQNSLRSRAGKFL